MNLPGYLIIMRMPVCTISSFWIDNGTVTLLTELQEYLISHEGENTSRITTKLIKEKI